MKSKPEPLKNIDWTSLLEICASHIEELDKREEDEDTLHYIYETAIETIYGREVWEWINNREK